MPIETTGYAAKGSLGILEAWRFVHRDLGPKDVHIRIVACGICQTDIHFGKNDWGISIYPCVPGHEITGYVESVGQNVVKFKPGDPAAVGITIDSCGTCHACNQKNEQYCCKSVICCNGHLKDGTNSYGGYARDIVCNEKFVCRYPKNLDMYSGAPLLCAGITIYSAMKRFGMDKETGKKLGVIGLGGLGHMAVKFGVAFGLEVTVISQSESKRAEAKELLGATNFLNSTEPNIFVSSASTLDFIIDTVATQKDMDAYMSLLRFDGIFVIAAIPQNPLQINGMSSLVSSRRTLAGSLVGSVPETEEMLDFCAEHDITATVEKVSLDYVNTAWKRLMASDVKFRFVIDVENSCIDLL